MRTTVLLEDDLVMRAKELSGLNRTSQVIAKALDEYVRRESQLRLAALGGTYRDADISVPSRRRIP